MANRTAVNPKVISTPSPSGLPRVKMLATDSKTWKKGELCIIANGAGTVEPLDGADSKIYGIFAEDQATSTSSTTVEVYRLITGTILEMYVTNNGTAAAIGVANLGVGYDAYEASNVCYLDVNGTTGAQFKVQKLCDSTDATSPIPERAAFDAQLTATAPGLCQVSFTEPATA